jgi:hypothetical protein
LRRQFNGLLTITRFNDIVSRHFQQPSHHETTVLKVLDHQN